MLGLYFGGRFFTSGIESTVGNLELDAVLDEGHSWEATVTTSPVEKGSDITDSIQMQPERLTVRGFVSDSPLVASATVAGVVNGGAVGNRTQAVFELLRRLMEARELVTVYTKYRIYTDMAIKSVDIPRSPEVGEALEFTMEFVKVRLVSTQLVELPKGVGTKNKVSKKTEPKKDAGKQQATEVTEEKQSSALKRTLEFIKNGGISKALGGQ